MPARLKWSRILVVVGLIATVAGAVDPLEGSLVILPGTALVAFAAWLGNSRHRRFLYWSFALVAIGVGAMFALSAIGGIGGSTGRSMWSALLFLPYPAGWVMTIVGAIRQLREAAAPTAPTAPAAV